MYHDFVTKNLIYIFRWARCMAATTQQFTLLKTNIWTAFSPIAYLVSYRGRQLAPTAHRDQSERRQTRLIHMTFDLGRLNINN